MSTIDPAGGSADLIFEQEEDGNGNYNAASAFNGTFYDIRIWDEVRSEPEIALNHLQKLDLTPSEVASLGLVANWQFDGFNGSNEVVDVVSNNNLSIGHATGTGFIASTPVEDLHISENATNGGEPALATSCPAIRIRRRMSLAMGLFLEGRRCRAVFG